MLGRKLAPPVFLQHNEKKLLVKPLQRAGGPEMVEQTGLAPGAPLPSGITQALASGQIPKFYANGMAITATPTDMTLIFLDNMAPGVAITIAYATAKSLVHDVELAIRNFEEKTGEKVRGINELMQLFVKK